MVARGGNTEELKRSTGAGPASRKKISAAFDQVKADLGIDPDRNWLEGYYQFCFQIAVLWFLQHHGVPARLLYLYFTGDRNPGYTCPANASEWEKAIDDMKVHVGIPHGHHFAGRIHKVFVPVAGYV